MKNNEYTWLFKRSRHGFKLGDKHFRAVYKTRLMKYNEHDACEYNCGNVIVAAIETGRRFLRIEKEPEYFKIAENHLE